MNCKLNNTFYSLIIISSIMTTSYIASNVLAVKLITVFSITLFDAGIIIFPLTYIIGNILTEIWGFQTAKNIILITFFCNIIFVLFTHIGCFLPYPKYVETTSIAFKNIFNIVPRILIASLLAFLVGEITNAWIMNKIKHFTNEKKLWIRTILSSSLGYLLDTIIFVLIAFSNVAPIKDLILMILFQYIIKIILECILGTPITYGVVYFLKKKGINSNE